MNEIDWDAVQAVDWRRCKEGKQAEFLIEQRFPWELALRVGVQSQQVRDRIGEVLEGAAHRPRSKSVARGTTEGGVVP